MIRTGARRALGGRARPRRDGAQGLTAAIAALVLIAAPRASRALVWPDVAVRVEQDLSATDPAKRLAAARDLASLGPGRGAPLALAALADDDDDVKLAAADAAIRLRAAGATDAVVPWLNATDARLRREACEVARALPDPRAVPPLARTLGDPIADVRSAAAVALGNQRVPEAVPPLLGRLDDTTPAVRTAIVAALAKLGDPRAVVPLVGKAEDSSPDVRQAVARALGDLGDARASAALVPALRDQSADVRREALVALGRLRATDAVDAIAPFATDRARTTALAAVEALGRIASPDALRVLVAALGTADVSAPPTEATPTRQALVKAGSAAVPLLHAILLGSPSPAASAGAAWVLGALHAHEEATTITASLRRGILPPAALLHALAGAGTAREVPIVLEFLTDPSELVRSEALTATASLLDPRDPDGRAVDPLAAALRSSLPTSRERARIAVLLGRTGALRASQPLVEIANSHDTALQIAAIDALGTLGPSGADVALFAAVSSKDPDVRLHAATALAESGAATARDALLALLAESDESDRPAILTALGGILRRIPSPKAVSRLDTALALAAGPERDALLEAIGGAPLPAAIRSLREAARSEEPFDRRKAASMCAAHPGDASALNLARDLLADLDSSVRAEAAWALATLGDETDVARLATALQSDSTLAANAAAAIGRIGARRKARDLTALTLCPLIRQETPVYARANALAGLALSGARCEGGSPERNALESDPREEVREAAALALANDGTASDRRALDRCARVDPSPAVADRCRALPVAPPSTNAVLVYVVPEAAVVPRPGAPFALHMADGMVHAGAADRRGAVFDPVAPSGFVSLFRVY